MPLSGTILISSPATLLTGSLYVVAGVYILFSLAFLYHWWSYSTSKGAVAIAVSCYGIGSGILWLAILASYFYL